MKSEASRAIIRFASNYVRLGLNLLLGLTFIRFFAGWVGEDALALLYLLGAGAGLGMIFRELSNRAAVRELGAAHHGGSDDAFRAMYNSALVVSAAAAILCAATFVAVYLLIPKLEIAPAMLPAAGVMVVSQGAYVTLATALAPAFNMLVVTERFIAYNVWTLVERASLLGAALFLRHVAHMNDPVPAVNAWSIAVAVLHALSLLTPVVILMIRDPRLRPSLRRVSRAEIRTLTPTLGWYFAVEVASALHEKGGQFIMTQFLGPMGSRVFGTSLNLVSYVRQTTQGVTFGLDAVSARLSSREGSAPLSVLLRHSTRVHGLVALPAGVLLVALAHPLMRLWMGGAMAPQEIATAATCVQILAIALTGRAISDGWMMILYGAGHLRRYAPLVLVGAVFNPVLSVTLLLMLPPGEGVFVTPWVFAIVYTVVHVGLLPFVGSRCLGVPISSFFIPLARPALATAAAAPVLVAAWAAVERWSLATTAIVGAAFGCAAAAASFGLVLTREERVRFVLGPLRRLRRSP